VKDDSQPSFLENLIERLQSKEALDLEFKSAKNGLPHSIWETVSAFANTQGGWIVLGIEQNENDGSVAIEGVPNASQVLQNFHSALRNPQKVSYAVCGSNDVYIDEFAGRQIIVVKIPAAPRKVRPVYVQGNAYSGTFVRRHAGDYRCTKPEVDRMMREASDVAADTTVLKNYAFHDLDPDSYARYRRQFQLRDPASPWNDYDDQLFLEAIRAYRYDRETGEKGITVAGLLLLGKPEALREWRTPHMLDYRLLSSDLDEDRRWEDRVPWEGNLFDGFSIIYRRLVAGLPVPFQLQGGMRVDQSSIHVALREALVNLLVHADYAETQASLIERSPTGFLFRNPGNSRVLEADLLIGGRSDHRNPELVRMFRMVGLAEEAGTGIPKIIRTWRELGLQLPPIDVGTERYEFTIDLRMAHMLSEEDRVWLSSLGDNWSEAEQLALVFAKHEGDVDNPRLRRLTGQHLYDITKVLGSLRDRHFLTMSRVGRTARYQLGPRALTPDVSMVGKQSSLVSTDIDLEPNESNLVDKHVSLVAREGDPSYLWNQLMEISEPVRKQERVSPYLRDSIIVKLCRHQPLSIAELSQLLNRNTDFVGRVVQHLHSEGYLDFLHPEKRKHPQQKYVASGTEYPVSPS
jgi:ATP-dependent DNA helicase RecG